MENPIGTMSVETDGVVWQDNYEEVVTYEEAINLDGSFDMSNENDGNNDNTESYETAAEDDSRYYSIVNETIVGGNENSFAENVSSVSLGAGDKNVSGDDAEETLVPKSLSEDCKMFESKNVLVNEEVVLYKIEGSNELYAVQFATDESGNLQKYQYQVRATEDGQFEAVPGTIELQPETNDENVYKLNPETNYKPSIDHDNYEVSLQEQYMTTMLQEPNVESEPNCAYVDGDGGDLNETQIEQLESADDTIHVDGHEMKDLYEEGMYEEYLEDSDESPSQTLPEYTDLKFFDAENGAGYTEGDSFEALGAKITEQIKCAPVDERFESIEPIIVRKSSGGTELHVLSEMIVPAKAAKRNSLNASKQFVPKADHNTALNKIKANIISIVQDNGIVKKRAPAVTHMLNRVKTNSMFDSYDFDIKPVAASRNVVDAKNNKKMTFLIVSRNSDVKTKEDVQKAPEMFKNSRSILKPTFRKSSGANYARVEPKIRRDHPAGLGPLKVPSLCAAPDAHDDVVLEKVVPADGRPKSDSSPARREPENKVSRQPRKQTIKPVDRVGSEIIIQPCEEDAHIVTYDLEVSDGEYASNKVKARKKKVPKKRGKKPKTLEIVLSDNDDDEETFKSRPDRSKPVDDDAEENNEADVVRPTGESDRKEISDASHKSDDEIDDRFVPNAEKPVEVENADAKSTTDNGSDLNNVMENVLSIMEEIHGEQSNDKHKIELRVDVKESENSETDLLSLLENTNSPSVEERTDFPTRRADKSPVNSPPSGTGDADPPTKIRAPDVADVARASKKNSGSAIKKAWKCSKCPKSFPNELTLKTHSQVHRIRKREHWQCEKCSKKFSFERFYDVHVKTHDDVRNANVSESRIPRVDCALTCDVCSKKFTSLSVYDAHMSFHRRRYRSNETFAGRSTQPRPTGRPAGPFRTKSGVVCSTPLKGAPPFQSGDSSRRPFHCDVCSKPFRQMNALMLHREQHKTACPTCGVKFRFRHLLDEHVRRRCLNSSSGKKKRNSVSRPSANHGLRRPNSNVDGELRCDVCARHFKTVFTYQTHVKFAHRNVVGASPRRATSETSKVPNRSTLGRAESGGGTVKNETAKRATQTDIGKKTNLIDPATKKAKEHRFGVPTTKNAERTSAVDPSEMVTERRQSIRKQVPSQKVTALKCTLCDLSFSTHTGLFRHTRTHSENKHKCDYCDIVLETIDLLASHIQSHMSSDSLACETCGEQFSTKRSFAEHVSRTSHKYAVDGRRTSSVKKVKILKRNVGHGGVPLSTKIQSFLAKRQKL